MFLKSLYISGFKSFAYPTRIDFTDDISAIIGPNGSGKSNITDAIRFVLGEQRTRLMRSNSIQDIIFSGTDSENPRGVAHVRLTLDREDKPDLIVERKVYRTGESEYLLNGKKVRLKDIQAEFWDTGLGRNGYSIISQGGVEGIVGASPLQLKELVEEAVGIAGYKAQKAETEKRLKHIESDIDRVSDILDEMKKQLIPLEKSANKTRQYLEISNVLRDIDLVSFYDKEAQYKKEREELHQQLVNLNFSILDLEKKADEKDQEYLRVGEEIKKLSEEISSLTEESEKLRSREHDFFQEENRKIREVETGKIKSEQLGERLVELEQTVEDDINALESIRNELIEKRDEVKQSFERTEKSKLELKTCQNTLSEVSRKREDDSVEKLQEKLNEKILKKVELETELKHRKRKVFEDNKRIGELKDVLAEIQNNIRYEDREKQKIEIEKSTLTEKLKTLIEERNGLDEKLRDLRSKSFITENNIDYQRRIKNNYSGFNQAVRAVMKYAEGRKLSGVFGTVSDLCEVEAKYQTAIQIALGASAQNIVVKNSSVAQNLIDYLKKSKKGRATFLPIDDIKPNVVKDKERLLKQPGVLGFANNLIKSDLKFEMVFSRLLGRTLIIDSYGNAQRFRKTNRSLTLVTLSGECFYASGAIVGGSVRKNARQVTFPNQEIKQLEEVLKKQKKEQEKIRASLNKKFTEINHVRFELNSINDRLSGIENILKEHNEKKLVTQNELNHLVQTQSGSETIEEELKTLLKEIDDLSNNINRFNEYSAELAQKESDLRNRISTLQQQVTDCLIDQEKAKLNLSQLEEKEFENEQRLNENRQKLNILIDQLNNLSKENLENQTNLKEITQFKGTFNENINQVGEKIKALGKKQNELTAYRIKLEDDIKDAAHANITEVEEKSRVERRLDKINFQGSKLEETIYEKYNVSLAMVAEQIEQLRKRRKNLSSSEIYDLKEELKAIGSVNINSIDEYNHLKNRANQLNKNYLDLVNSKEDVEDTILRLNATMTKQLEDKFSELNKLFSQAFTILFEGGKSHLDYIDKSDILNSGIELFAQPPGKHLKSINLLSGGEKAMTAIALLFAFIQLNPAPFIIIDEIDAALDDSNINRFTRYIEKIEDNNQFIVITHRKATVQMCNKIHGISMAEDGISRCCSFEMADYLE